ncbi:NB-ARC domain-containing protein [uncultured Hoeflea sp.]|uniref:NB-ARC domain-containing protein n=1 Tax=uncultured Hoeflea sp. TaxID=538666 RepID=UPI002602192E|nr:NB-ARC domain-containing protein [uncultured Hoeflea sp.]
MTIVSLSTFDEFRTEVVNTLKEKAETDRNRRERSLFEREYKGRVQASAVSFKENVLKHRPGILNDALEEWFSLVKEKPTTYKDITSSIFNTTINNLKNGQLNFSIAIHYRLHAQLVEKWPRSADCDIRNLVSHIDDYLFGGSFRSPSGDPIFGLVPDSHKDFSYPQIVDLKDAYQAKRPEFRKAKQLFLDNKSSTIALSASVYGAGGYGKSSLAQELSSDKTIREAYPGGIYWLQFGFETTHEDGQQTRYRSLRTAIHQTLLEQFAPDARPKPLLEGTDRDVESFLNALPDLPILLIADDVWNSNQSSWFSRLPDHVALLITTRVETVAASASKEIKINRLTDEASFQLLTHGMPDLNPVQNSRLSEIAKQFNGWPLILSLANGVFKNRGRTSSSSIDQAIARYESFLTSADIVGWDLDEPGSDSDQKRQKFVGHCIEESLLALGNNRPDLLCDLSVFPDDTDVPISIVTDYWNHAAIPPTSQENALTLLDLYRDYSFFSAFDEDAGTVRLHDEILSYFRWAQAQIITEKHRQLLASIQTHCSGDNWETLDVGHHYGWKYLLFHLEAQGLSDDANDLRTEYRWLKAKLLSVGSSELRNSFVPVPNRDDARLVGQAIALSANILQKRPNAFAHQMFGRLGHGFLDERITRILIDATRDSDFYPKFSRPHLPMVGLELTRLNGHEATVKSAKVSSDGKRILTRSADGDVRLWRASTGEQVSVLKRGSEFVFDTSFSPDGNQIITASDDANARIWDGLTGEFVRLLDGHKDTLSSAVFSNDGRHVVTASSDGSTILWDAKNGDLLQSLACENGPLNFATLSPDGTRLITLFNRGIAILWSTETGDAIRHLDNDHCDLSTAQFSRDGQRILILADCGKLRLWDAGNFNILKLIPDVSDFDFSADGRCFVYASYDCYGRLIDPEYCEELCIHDSATGQNTNSFQLKDIHATGAAFASDGDRIVTPCQDGKIRIWSIQKSALIGSLTGHTDMVIAAEFTPDGKSIASASVDRTVRIWDVERAIIDHADPSEKGAVKNVEFSEDGSSVISQHEKVSGKPFDVEIDNIWDTKTEYVIKTMERNTEKIDIDEIDPFDLFYSLRAAPKVPQIRKEFDSLLKLVGDPFDYVIQDISVNYRRMVTTTSVTGVLELYDIEKKRSIGKLRGHQYSVNDAAFSKNDDIIVTVSNDTKARIWCAKTGTFLRSLDGHRGKVTKVQIAEDGQSLVTISGDFTVRFWNAITGKQDWVVDFDAMPRDLAMFKNKICVGLSSGEVVFITR